VIAPEDEAGANGEGEGTGHGTVPVHPSQPSSKFGIHDELVQYPGRHTALGKGAALSMAAGFADHRWTS
jgi:hypothetical protein